MQPPKLSYSEACQFVRNKPQYHETMGRNGWLLPKRNSRLCTLEFMQLIRDGKIYCPKLKDENKTAVCFTPPPKEILMDKLEKCLRPKLSSGDFPES